MIKCLIGLLLRSKSFNCLIASLFKAFINMLDVLGSESVITMGCWCVAATVLAFTAIASASVGSNTLDDWVSPLLVSLGHSRNIEALDAIQAPLLVRLSRQSPPDSVENEAKSLDERPQAILVRKW